MAIGTAGFTAALSLRALLEGQATPDQGDVLVTGASGGVGSMAVFLAAHAGFRVCAVTGKSDTHAMLTSIGAAAIISRDDVLAARARALAKARWAHAIDTVGGDMLDAALRATAPGGVVTTCGMVASAELNTNVYPFILRGIRLQGIDAAETPMDVRQAVWAGLGHVWTDRAWAQIVREVELDAAMDELRKMADGKSRGRVVVRVAHDDH
jgi:putative YhdH/YhfP family quinone oxidoreductase